MHKKMKLNMRNTSPKCIFKIKQTDYIYDAGTLKDFLK